MLIFRKLIKTDNLFFRTPDGATMYITNFAGVADYKIVIARVLSLSNYYYFG